MLAKPKKQIEVSLEKGIISDFEKIKSLPEEKRMNATFKLIKNILKSAIGKPHEYTIEESLFILKEELDLSGEPYNRIKEVLLHFSYFKYGQHGKVMTNDKLDEIEHQIISILPSIITNKNEVEAEKIYNEIKGIKTQEPEDNKAHMVLKNHKKDIMETEKNIVSQIENELNEEIEAHAEVDNDIIAQESNPETQSIEESYEFKNTEEELDQALEKHDEEIIEDPEEEPKDIQIDDPKLPEFIPKTIPADNDFTEFGSIKLSFSDLFQATTGFTIDQVINYEFDPKQVQVRGWDLHIKYHLLRGKSLSEIKQHYENKIDPQMLERLLEKNEDFLLKTSKYAYMKTIQEITIILTISLIIGNNLGKESKLLVRKGFQKDEVNFVLENLLKSF